MCRRTMSWMDADEKKYSWRRRSSCPGCVRIRRIEHAHEAFGAHLPGQRTGMIAGVERIELDRIGREGVPTAAMC